MSPHNGINLYLFSRLLAKKDITKHQQKHFMRKITSKSNGLSKPV